MIQNRRDMQSQSDQFDPSSKARSGRVDVDQMSSSDIHNDDSQQPESQLDGSDRSYGQEEQDESDNDISKQEALEKEIMKLVTASQQKRKPFQREIMGDILDKLKNYEAAAAEKEGEELVTLRIQQLVYSKLLVLTYGCSEFRLVLAHFHLGHAYLRHDCTDQTIEHISIALYKNEKLFQQFPRTKLFHCIMQNILAECLIKKQQFDDAIQILKKSISLAEQTNESEQVSNRAKILLAQCYTKLKQYNQAIRIIEQVIQSTEDSQKQQYYAFALVEKATILAMKGDYRQAIQAQDKAINILIKQNYPKPEQVAQMYAKLGDYFEKMENIQSSLSCIQKVKTLYQQIYSKDDKRVIKARRRIATSLLKNQRYKQAVNELLEIIELQQKVFGQSSIQTARTLKLLGTVYIKLETGDARTYLKRAMNIFNVHGNKKQVQQIRQKLKILMQTSSNNNDLKILSEQDL